MNYEIIHKGAFPALKVDLEQGEAVKAESGAMVSKEVSIEVDGKMDGGLLGGIGRMMAGEKFFFQTLTAKNGKGSTILAPAVIGDIEMLELDGSTEWSVQKDGFFAGEMGIDVNTKMQNLSKGLFSGAGFFVVKIAGKGKLFISSFGSIHKIEVPAGEEYIVDNGHLVAWPSTMQYSIEKAAKGWIKSMTSGEGLVARFKGPGTVYIQTRNAGAFGSWLSRFMPLRK